MCIRNRFSFSGPAWTGVIDRKNFKILEVSVSVFVVWGCPQNTSSERPRGEPITRGLGTELLLRRSRGKDSLKLKHFWLLDIQWKPQICPLFMRERSYCFQRVLAIAILSVRLSVCHTGGLVKSGASYNHQIFTVGCPEDSSFRKLKAFP